MANQTPYLNFLLHYNQLGNVPRGDRATEAEAVRDSDPFERAVQRALLVEEAGFDGLFQGDGGGFNRENLTERLPFGFEPFTLLSGLAARTTRLGLVATVGTSYNDPYNLARRFASLDRISNGRAAWNEVTGYTESKNFGTAKLPPPEERYKQAQEFVEVVLKLWTAWKPGYFKDGVLDANKIEDVNHDGTYFHVEDALGVPPSPQGHPILVHAGSSEPGIDLGGRYGEVIYIAAPTFDHAVEQAAAFRAKAKEYGRSQDSLKIMPGLYAYFAPTHEEAEASRHQNRFSDDQLLKGLRGLKSQYSGFDFSEYELDDVLDQDRLPTKEEILTSDTGRRSRALLYLEFANKHGATLRSFLSDVVSGTGHATIIGSFDEVADELERWHRAGAADAFALMGASSLEGFINEILPRLERKGIFTKRPEITTFRERLGLPVRGTTAESAEDRVPAGAVA